ncbi:MAG TPA: Uma2 family endonuclease [Chloroflexota bacterium]|nr:Uma2 family endonuclease [Chloroflexota bacterium]
MASRGRSNPLARGAEAGCLPSAVHSNSGRCEWRIARNPGTSLGSGKEQGIGRVMQAETAATSTVQPRRWTREEYERLGETGVLGPEERVELIDGEIIEVPPQLSRHATGVCLISDALRALFRTGFTVRTQLPLGLGDYSEPEPDVAVVRGTPRDFTEAHPTTAVLVVEVSDTTLSYDRDTKGSLYAAAGIPEYWILNLVDRQLEVYHDPGALPGARFGSGYRTRVIALPGDAVDAPALTGARVAVDDLLP